MRRNRRRHHSEAFLLFAALFLFMAALAFRALATLALIAVIVAGGIAAKRLIANRNRPARRIPARPPQPGMVRDEFGVWTQPAKDAGELDRLREENARLRRGLADAEESAHAAWDAASEPRPRAASDDLSPMRDRLINDPRSGARGIGNPKGSESDA